MPAYALVTEKIEHTWTDEYKAHLRQLWADKFMTCDRIADRLNALFDTKFTKNSVISAAKRIGLEKRRRTPRPKGSVGVSRDRSQVRLTRKVVRTVAPIVQLLDIAPNDLDIPQAQRKQLLALGDCDCRFPVGEPGSKNFFFCGGLAVPGKPYCPAHCARAFVRG